MAEIVNRKRGSLDTAPKPTLEQKKHDLMNHVSVDKLYEYNPVIQNIHQLSKAFFSQYITEGVKHWSDKLNQLGFIGVSYGRDKNDSNGEIFSITIKQKEDVIKETSNEPIWIRFSVMEILDPYDISPEDSAESYMMLDRISSFIDLGAYPLVCAPANEKSFYDSFEKYDSVTHGRPIIGTIVDINAYTDAKSKNHFVATIMWAIDEELPYPKEFIYSKSGYLKICDMIKTPSLWSDTENVDVTNIGIPVYEFHPMRQLVEEITFVDKFQDYINEAVVTGNIELDFVTHLLQHTGETLSQVAQIIDKVKEGSASAEKKVSQTSSNPAAEDGTPIENAAEEDLFGHRLRLYDEDFDDGADDGDFPSDFSY